MWLSRWSLAAILVFSLAVAPRAVLAKDASGTPGHDGDYAGAHGPRHWGALKAEYATCMSGKHQSPIDIYQNLTDGVADTLLTECVSIEKERARLKAKYLPKFKQVLPPRKGARFYQIENKLDIALLAQVAQGVPLTR